VPVKPTERKLRVDGEGLTKWAPVAQTLECTSTKEKRGLDEFEF